MCVCVCVNNGDFTQTHGSGKADGFQVPTQRDQVINFVGVVSIVQLHTHILPYVGKRVEPMVQALVKDKVSSLSIHIGMFQVQSDHRYHLEFPPPPPLYLIQGPQFF